jgi:hypothetical protein
MLASITPLGERGRHSHWGVTVTAFVAGAGAAGALLGTVTGGIGSLLLDGGVSLRARLAVLAGAALVAFALDALMPAPPGPRRQVDERWLDRFRGWVYGLGYGVQLGLGVTTVVSSAATYLALTAALLLADAGAGAVVMGCFGLMRGISLLAGARVHSPEQLIALHAWLERGRVRGARVGIVLLAVISAGALIGAAL